jgi:pyochelin biosynthetic protein PchC
MADIAGADGDGSAEPWLRLIAGCPAPRARILCFPHAGGGAGSYLSWAPLSSQGIEVWAARYPGREDRFVEPFATTMDELAAPVARSCGSLTDRPLALFGHSMGASAAYEVALRLQAEYAAPPVALFVSGREAPGSEKPRRTRADDPDDELISGILELGGTHEDVFRDGALRELVLPIIRADYRVLEAYAARAQVSPQQLNCPIAAYYGTGDAYVDGDSVGRWADATKAEFSVRAFPGGHFYLQDAGEELRADIAGRLSGF